jgi:hypothetical protein
MPDLFGLRLSEMIDLCNSLAVLASRLPWAQIRGQPQQQSLATGAIT